MSYFYVYTWCWLAYNYETNWTVSQCINHVGQRETNWTVPHLTVTMFQNMDNNMTKHLISCLVLDMDILFPLEPTCWFEREQNSMSNTSQESKCIMFHIHPWNKCYIAAIICICFNVVPVLCFYCVEPWIETELSWAG